MVRASLLLLLVLAPSDSYKGTPYRDSRHAGEAQKLPGRMEFALYDQGGEGIAYHDTEPKNLGSGALNPADGSYLNEFRMREGVDTSYTWQHEPGDAQLQTRRIARSLTEDPSAEAQP